MDVSTSLVSELRIVRGGQGVWRDSAATIGEDVTVGLRHTGRVYEDDVDDEVIIYHYPTTKRAGQRDAAEIKATKNAKTYNLPIFLVTEGSKSNLRSVRLAYVEDWNDEDRIFLLHAPGMDEAERRAASAAAQQQAEQLIDAITDQAEADGVLLEGDVPEVRRALREVLLRPHQQRFRFACMKRYGARCAVCSIDVQELLQAAHIIPKAEAGSDEATNGLMLCALHHLAYDRHLWSIDPDTGLLLERSQGPSLASLGITKVDLHHLPAAPEVGSLRYRSKIWLAK